MTTDTVPPPTVLPRVATLLSEDQVLERLSAASKRGRLPGFQAKRGGLFSVAAHGMPFDGVLTAQLREGHMEFALRMLPRLPAIFIVVLLFTIWPGVYFMDELVAQFLPSLWRPWVTYYWYLPITVIPIPWIWRGLMRRSRAALEQSSAQAIAKIAAEVDGQVIQPTPR